MRKFSVILALPTLSLVLLSIGCGQQVAGSYAMTQTLTGGGALSATCQSVQSNLSLSTNGSAVTGNTTNTCYTESLTGTDNGNQINNVTLTITPVGAYAAQGYSCIYNGTLTVSNNQISGTLGLQSQGAIATTVGNGYGYGYGYGNGTGNYGYSSSACSSTVSMNGTLTN